MNMYEVNVMIDWQILLLVAVPVLLVALVFHRQNKAMKSLQAKSEEQQQSLEKLQQDFRAMMAGAVGVDERIIRIEKRIRRLVERQEQLETSQNSGRPYDQAIRMVHKGSSLEDIMSVCELSRGEAELIMMMHSVDKAG